MSYRISRRANADIEAICNHIAKDNANAADRLDQLLHRTFQMLAQFPGMGRTRLDVWTSNYYFWKVGNCIVAYRAKDKQLVVVRVLHTARDFRKLFKVNHATHRMTAAGQIEQVELPPNGTSDDFRFIFAGAKMTPLDAKLREKAIQSNPDDWESRLTLLGFYGKRPTKQEKYFQHMLWMIDTRSSDYVSNYMGHEYHSRALIWNKSREHEASARWSRQVRKHPDDSRVLCNAASFFEKFNSTTSERLYKRAKKVDVTFAKPARMLAYEYRYRAWSGPQRDRARLVRLALKEADEALQRGEGLGERVGLLTEFTPTAIKFGYLEQARKFAKRLQYYGKDSSLWNQYAYLFLAWLDFRENRNRALNFKLKRLQSLFEEYPTHVASCHAARSFVNDVLDSELRGTAQNLLRVLISGTDDQKEKKELEKWLIAITDQRNAKLKLLKKKLYRLF
jgi:plasmid stabilization system protein ParE